MEYPLPTAMSKLGVMGLRFQRNHDCYVVEFRPESSDWEQDRIVVIIKEAFPGGFKLRATWTFTQDYTRVTVFPR